MGAAGMSGLAVRNQNGEAVHYTGSQFSGLENTGTHHLCVRTGTGADDVVKYGLTSTPLNDKYKGLRMRIPDHAGGNGGRDAYIAQRYSVSESASSSKTYTASRVSNYVSSTTLRTASSSRLSTYTATRSTTWSRRPPPPAWAVRRRRPPPFSPLCTRSVCCTGWRWRWKAA